MDTDLLVRDYTAYIYNPTKCTFSLFSRKEGKKLILNLAPTKKSRAKKPEKAEHWYRKRLNKTLRDSLQERFLEYRLQLIENVDEEEFEWFCRYAVINTGSYPDKYYLRIFRWRLVDILRTLVFKDTYIEREWQESFPIVQIPDYCIELDKEKRFYLYHMWLGLNPPTIANLTGLTRMWCYLKAKEITNARTERE